MFHSEPHPNATASSTPVGARQRILEAAYELFSHRGIRAVGVDEVIERAGVAKATLYRHFPSKDQLVLAFLDLRQERWMHDFMYGEPSELRELPADQRLLSIFDSFDDWFRQEDFEACPFIKALLEMGPGHPAGRASIGHLESIRHVGRRLAEEAQLRDTDEFSRSWHLLIKGSIVAAAEGDREAVRRAKSMAGALIGEHRDPATAARRNRPS